MNKLNDKGYRHGLWEEYHQNGGLWCKANYANGKLHGPYESYHDNGQLWWKGIFLNAQEVGFWLNGKKNGIIDKEFFL